MGCDAAASRFARPAQANRLPPPPTAYRLPPTAYRQSPKPV